MQNEAACNPKVALGCYLNIAGAGLWRFVVEPPNLLSEMNLLNCRFFRQLVRRFGSRFGKPPHIELELPSIRFAGSRNLFEPLPRKRQLQVFKALKALSMLSTTLRLLSITFLNL